MAKKSKGKIKIQTESALRKKYAGSGNANEILVAPENMLWIPSRFLALNDQWGGGACYGKIHEVFGEESSGKSLLAFDFAYSTQALGGVVLWADAEFAFMRDWAEKNGLDLTQVELYPEKAIELISDWTMDMGIYYRSKLVNNQPILVVIDSIAALDCIENLNSSQLDAKAEMGNRAKQMDKWLRTRNGSYEQLGITVILVNQLRSKIGASQFEDPDCLHYNTTIPLTDGTFKTIGEIVENKLNVKVWSYQEGEIVEKEISDWVAKYDWSEEDKWYNLQTNGPSTRNGVNGITCTGGHLVMSSLGDWVRADRLKVGHLLLSKAMLPNEQTNDLLETMSIGDMGISIRKNNSGSITIRDNNNPEYVNWKLSLLEPIVSFEKDIDNRGYLYYRSDYHYFLSVIKRKINKDPLNCNNIFNSLSMAIWYMDDGHLHKNGQASISISPNRTNLEKLALIITNRGFECKPYKKGIKFTKKGSDRLFKHISKNIHYSMLYKLPGCYHDTESNSIIQPLALELKPIEVMVTKIEEAGERNYRGIKGKIKYDLSIEGTKNFLAGNTTNGFIVHNTTPGGKATKFYASIRVGIYGGKQITKKIKGKDRKIGRLTSIRVKKNKVAPPKPTLKGAQVYFTEGHENGIGFNKYFGLPELLIEKEVVTRKKGSSRYYMGDKMIANGEEAFLRKLYEDEELRKKLIRKSGINTISKTRKQLERIGKNLYPVITTDFEKHQDIEDDEE